MLRLIPTKSTQGPHVAIPKAWLIAPSAAGVLLLSATSAPEARGKDQACYELLLPRAIEP